MNKWTIYLLSGKGCNELKIESFYGNVIFKWQFEALKCRTYWPQKQNKRQLFFYIIIHIYYNFNLSDAWVTPISRLYKQKIKCLWLLQSVRNRQIENACILHVHIVHSNIKIFKLDLVAKPSFKSLSGDNTRNRFELQPRCYGQMGMDMQNLGQNIPLLLHTYFICWTLKVFYLI